MEIISISANQCLGWILSYPDLAEKSFSMDNPKFDQALSHYIGFVADDDIVATVKYERFCDYAIQVHCYVNPKFSRTRKIYEAFQELKDFFKGHEEKSLVVMCPEDCEHVSKTCRKLGFEKIGEIKEAVNWKGEINNMIILQVMF